MSEGTPSQIVEKPGVDPTKVPPATQAEFGPRPFGKETKNELDALEASINAQLSGQIPPVASPAPAPAAAIGAQPESAIPPAIQSAVTAQVPPTGVPVPPGTHIPDKFRLPDGTLAAEKVQAALVNLERYLEKEREMSQRKQGLPPNVEQAIPLPATPAYPYGYPGNPPAYPQTAYGWPQPQTFEQRVNDDLQKDPGGTVVNLMRAAVANAEAQASMQTRDLRMKLELLEIAQSDPGVFTKEGLERLAQVREANPWLDNSPTPWTHAYRLAGPILPRIGQQATVPVQVGATPAPARMPAPILPGGQMPPAIPMSGPPTMTSESDLRRWLQDKAPNNPMKQAELLEALSNDMNRRRGGV